MPFVLSIVHAPLNGAAYGKAVVLDPVEYCAQASYAVARALINAPQHVPAKRAKAWAKRYFDTDYVTGTGHTHQLTGLTFRIDRDDHAPNACPCCGRLVNFQDHALAGSDDAYCLGCFTWERGAEPCLPENTAHAKNEKD